MKGEWQRVKLGEVADLTMGQSPQGKDMNTHSEGVPFLQGNRTFGHLFPSFDTWTTAPTKMAKSGDVIMSVRAPVGDLNIAPADFCLGRGVCSMRMKNGEQRFLYYLMQVVRQRLIQQENGTTFGSVNRNDINGLEVDIPPLPTQRRIAAVLGALDDKIELNRKMNANLEAQAQALFKSWFVDFEPWDGRMPTGWKMGKAQDFFDISIGKTPPRKIQELFSTDKDQNETWVSIADMGNAGVFIDNSSEYLIPSAVKDYNVSVAPKDSVLLSFKLTVGRVCIASQDLTTNEAIAQFKPNKAVPKEFIYLYLKNFNYEKLGSTSSIATAVNSKMIKAMTFVLPPADVLTKFAVTIRPLFDSILNNQHESRKLAELRDALLPKLMSGELEVA